MIEPVELYKVSDHFILQEFLPPEMFTPDIISRFGSVWGLLRFIDKDIVDGIEKIRRRFDKPIIINNWHKFQASEYDHSNCFRYRCFRPFSYKEGSTYGEHRFGRAIDFSVMGIDSLEVQAEITKDWSEYNAFFQGIEKNTSGWTHLCKMWTLGNNNKPILIPIPK